MAKDTHILAQYSPGKTFGMALLCGLGLPILSPISFAFGPAAIILFPLLFLGGPVCALFCLWRGFIDRNALKIEDDQLYVSSLWSTTKVAPSMLREVSLDEQTSFFVFIPMLQKTFITVECVGGISGTKTKKLRLSLLDIDLDRAHEIVSSLQHDAMTYRPDVAVFR
ncbi:MAG: hypothetical protein SXU28_01480 [Pseudomonadota bacterium]|nr:hypothetical protein [Pseudomonadota bacterium]